LAKNRQIGKEAQHAFDADLLRARVLARLDDALAQPMLAALYLVATPIGHLADFTLRAASILARADSVYCEDTRHSRQLLAQYGISRSLKPYHEHNEERELPRVLEELAAGRSVALISDAGTPLVSDPGFKLVREALAAGFQVVSIPGPSAPIAALACSGLPTDRFLFAGFLPPKQSARRARLAELSAIGATLIFFEAPSRLADSLSDMAETLGPSRGAVVARELTKLHEEVRRGLLGDLARSAAEIEPRGEIVVLVGPPPPSEVADEEIVALLQQSLAHSSVRDASREVAEALGVPRSRVYDLAVRIRRGDV
jgi:16S rRNA (cytidine1402-2'-O)-methyltransferase